MPENKPEKTKSPKERVIEKFNIAKDLQESKLEVSGEIKKLDDKYMGRFEVYGIKPKNSKGGEYPMSRQIKKVFDNPEEFTEYFKELSNKSDEEIQNLAE